MRELYYSYVFRATKSEYAQHFLKKKYVLIKSQLFKQIIKKLIFLTLRKSY